MFFFCNLTLGAISDSSGSLRAALQITWVAMAVAGAVWWYGFLVLPALPPPQPVLSLSPSIATSGSDDVWTDFEGVFLLVEAHII